MEVKKNLYYTMSKEITLRKGRQHEGFRNYKKYYERKEL